MKESQEPLPCGRGISSRGLACWKAAETLSSCFILNFVFAFGILHSSTEQMTPSLNPDMEKGLIFSRDGRGIAELELLGHGSAQTASGMSLPAGTSPGKPGECKNIGVRGEKRGDVQGFLLAGFLQDGAGWC